MTSGVWTERRDLLVRRCVACGAVAAPSAVARGRCHRCECDFSMRRPLTYAEMEGFDAPAAGRTIRPVISVAAVAPEPVVARPRHVRRWLVVVAAAVVLLALGVRLLAASLG